MASVNSTIKGILQQKDAGIVSGTQAVRDILMELQQQVMSDLGKAALGSWDSYQLRNLLNSIEAQIGNFEGQMKIELGQLLDEAWKYGVDLSMVPAATVGIGGFYIATDTLNAWKDFTFHKIEGLSSDAWYKIKGELTLGVLGGKTPQEVANAIGQNMTDKSIFSSIEARAEVITKTEMGRVFSQANQLGMEKAMEYVPGLEKQWKHAGHPKQARPTHVLAHDQHVPVSQPFIVGNVAMMFPRAPGAPLDEVINCGCDHVPYHARWA